MALKYKTNIEITSEAANKEEAMEIVGEYLSGNIASGIDMRYTTNPVRFYNNAVAKTVAIMLLVTVGFLSGIKAKPNYAPVIGTCQMAAVQPPLNTSDVNKNFKKEWQDKQTREALDFLKK